MSSKSGGRAHVIAANLPLLARVRWARRGHREASPFERRTERVEPLRICFHDASLSRASGEEQAALSILRELVSVPGIEALSTQAGTGLSFFEIQPFQASDHVAEVRRMDADGKWAGSCTLHYPNQVVERLGKRTNSRTSPKAHVAADDLLALAASEATGTHLFVTLSQPALRSPHVDGHVADGCPLRPTDALRIVGLFLRCHDTFCVGAVRNPKYQLSRWAFYWVLTRERLPNMWRYFGACVLAKRGDDTLYVGQSILTRCYRAIRARDYIGSTFHVPQDDHVREDAMYHFDYLTLLLAGALDAQALIAERVYGLGFGQPSFRDDGFKKALKASAARLAGVVSGRGKELLCLLFELRNTIHHAGLNAHGAYEAGRPERSIIRFEPSAKLIAAAKSLGGFAAWGMEVRRVRYHREGVTGPAVDEYQMEPYSFAARLVHECLALVDSIARETEVEKLFGAGTVPSLKAGPEDEGLFAVDVRERVRLLG